MSVRIFEARYKEMLRECMDADRTFGIVLIKSGPEVGGHAETYQVGTIARIVKIGAPARSGLPIEVVGERRFKIASVDRTRAFLTAMVEPFDDVETHSSSPELLRHSRKALRRFITGMLAARGVWSGGIRLPRDPVTLSYLTGSIASDAPEMSRQKVLEADSLSSRLQAGIALLESEESRVADSIMRSGPGQQESRFSLN